MSLDTGDLIAYHLCQVTSPGHLPKLGSDRSKVDCVWENGEGAIAGQHRAS
ncbi:MAG: hypothetical protein GDA56_14900 [Hormoscilla sp. GM7CHS1pb]|nr:hypothetical protein [Hormoscilla sp. GM7CHS1pb]